MGIQEYILAGSKLPIHNHYQLRLTRLESQQPGVDISVLKFSGTEAISGILRYEIEFTSAVKDIPARHIINYSALFLMYPDGKPWEPVIPRIIPGVITQFRQCSTSADETRYVATLEHRLTRLNQGSNNAVYQNDSVISMTENTFLRYNMDRLDFRFALNDQYPLKKFMMQFGESEYAHIARRLADSGISYFFEYDEENNCDVMVLADHSYAWPEPVAIPFRNPAGMFDGGLESVWEMSVSRKSIPKSVTVNDDFYPNAQSDMTATTATNPDYPALVAEDYRWGEYYPEPGKEYSSEPGQGMWYAKRRQERYLSEQITFEGKSNCMTLRPGMLITTPGKDWPEAPDGLLIVSTESKNVARDTAYFVTFTAVPRNTQHPYRPALLPWPTVTGTLPARISSAHPDEPYAHINADGLYRAQFGFDRTAWQKGFESCWLRLARPYSGDTYGFHMPLLDSTGVAIAFENGDVDRPYIAYALHDSRHPDHVALPNYKRNVIRTPANNKLRLDDTRGKEHIKLSTPASGKSQLNLGALVDDKRKDRGHGAELRTDDWVSVRGGKGVFISADVQASAGGQQLDMQQAKALLSSARVEMQSLSTSAQQAQALAADIDRQQTLLQQKLDKLQQAVLLLSAPKGVGIVSGDSMQLYAEDSLTLTAGKQVDIGATKKFTVAAGEQISLYSRQGTKMFAAKGDIDVQAQGGKFTTWSTDDTHIASGKKMTVTAQDELVLICGGAYIKLKGGNVEIGGPGKLLVKNSGIVKQSAASMQSAMKSFEPEQFNEGFVVTHPLNGKPLASQKYKITLDDVQIIEGLTDEKGMTSLTKSQAAQDMVISLLDGE
ncbi:type VI secretion system tip protein VgrG [Rahnella sp. AA]|uniref:type VI secretion system Vgr family protein n=1 Tax=Rahnella sp. AA TaxID=2057180 RepID=UPI000C34B7D2|nr:type VI secretion system Vgr family protein [Rahnella sp. AA]PKE27427.1 type VI secretion system tip protein VgrG [Rahnella sp. AA]